MKRYGLLLLGIPLLFLFASCEPEPVVYNHPEALMHHWIITNEAPAQAPLTLTFTEDGLAVKHSCSDLPPFDFDASDWEYTVEQDSILYIWRDETYYSDDESYTDYQEEAFVFHFSSNNRLLELFYLDEGIFHTNLHHYTFLRR